MFPQHWKNGDPYTKPAASADGYSSVASYYPLGTQHLPAVLNVQPPSVNCQPNMVEASHSPFLILEVTDFLSVWSYPTKSRIRVCRVK